MNKEQKLADLRHLLAHYTLPDTRPPVRLGNPAADALLGGGLKRGALHDVFALDWGASGFAALLALKAAGRAPLFWVRPDYEALEYGGLYAPGLLELGGHPENVVLVRVPHATEGLAAAHDILACPHVGALVLELGGHPKSLDLTASRRLALAAGQSGVPVFMLREGARDEPSAAHTRWMAASAPSRPGDEDWGAPRFAVRLTRHRGGNLGDFLLEWDCVHEFFVDPRQSQSASPHPGLVAAAPAHGQAETVRRRAL